MIKLLLLGLTIALTSAVWGEELAPKPLDFAYAIDIDPKATDTAFRLQIPHSVYANVASPKLNDIRVFNRGGETLPFEVSYNSAIETAQATIVPFVALQSKDKNLEQLQLFYQEEDGKRQFSVSPEVIAGAADSTTYILNMKDVSGTREQLELDWQFDKPGSYFFSASVDASDDLQDWSFKQNPSALAQLALPGETMLHNRVAIKHCDCIYYRLVLTGEDRPTLKEIRVLTSATESKQTKKSAAVSAVKQPDSPRDFIVDTANFAVKSAVRIPLTQNNTIAQVAVYSAATVDGPWQRRGESSLYRVQSDTGVQVKDSIEMQPTNDRFLKIALQSEGSGLEASLAEIEYDWVPHNLTFVARGDGPYRLAFGSAAYSDTRAEYGTVFAQLYKQSKPTVLRGDSALSAKKQLGGPSKLHSATTPQDTRWLLWLALSLASALLLWMAWSTWQSAATGRSE